MPVLEDVFVFVAVVEAVTVMAPVRVVEDDIEGVPVRVKEGVWDGV